MFHVIINPASRSGRALALWKNAEHCFREAGISYKVYFSQYQGHIEKICRDLTSDGQDVKLVVFGGDGTVNEAINGIQDFDHVQLGYVPTGSSNDLARGLGLAKDPLQVLSGILEGETARTVDLGVVHYLDTENAQQTNAYKNTPQEGSADPTGNSSRRFIVSAGIGFDAAICQEVSVSPFKKVFNKLHLGKLIYLAVAIRLILTQKMVPATVTLTEETARRATEEVKEEAVKGTAERKADEAAKGTSEKKADEAIKGTSEKKADEAIKGTSEKKADEAIKGTSEKKADEAIKGTSEKKADEAIKGTSEKKADEASKKSVKETPLWNFRRFLFIVCMNHPYEGGGFKFCPGAQSNDGLPDLCGVADLNRLMFFYLFPKAYSGGHVGYKGIHNAKGIAGSSIRIRTQLPFWVHTDGEVRRKSSDISIETLPGVLRLMM